MNHLRLHDIWLYIIALVLFGIFILLIYIVYRCADKTTPRKRRNESVLQFNIEGSAQNLMANLAEWKGDELPSYVSQWSFQNECDKDLEWKRQLSLKSYCKECEKLLNESQKPDSLIISNEIDMSSHVTAV